MVVKSTKPTESIELHTVATDKFKTGMLALSVCLPRSPLYSPYNLLLSGIMRRGTANYPSIASLNRRLDELYAATIEIKSVNYGKNELLLFSAELLDDKYATDSTDITGGVIDILHELLLCPLLDADGMFKKKSVEQEKKIAADALRAVINNPRSYSLTRCAELMNRDNKDAPTLESMIKSVESCDRRRLTDFYTNEIASLPIDIFYVGSHCHSEIEKKILSAFSSHKATKTQKTACLTPSIKERPTKSVTEKLPVSQGKLAMGFRTGICADNDDYYALVLLNEIFGGSPASKLFMNVREKMSLCYYCSSSYNMYTGSMLVSSGIEIDDKELAKNAILSELEDIKNGKISDTEYSAAKKSLENWYKQIYDNPFELHGFYAGRSLFGIDCTVEECIEKLAEVTLEDVIRVSKKIALDTEYFLCGTSDDNDEEDDNE